MRDEQQFEQLMMQYQQLKTGADDIFQMINAEEYDDAITMIKSRESVFLNCKCMLKYLELTGEQKKQVDEIVEEIRTLEKRNMDILNKNLNDVRQELKKTQQSEKIQSAYEFDEDKKGSIINIKDNN